MGINEDRLHLRTLQLYSRPFSFSFVFALSRLPVRFCFPVLVSPLFRFPETPLCRIAKGGGNTRVVTPFLPSSSWSLARGRGGDTASVVGCCGSLEIGAAAEPMSGSLGYSPVYHNEGGVDHDRGDGVRPLRRFLFRVCAALSAFNSPGPVPCSPIPRFSVFSILDSCLSVLVFLVRFVAPLIVCAPLFVVCVWRRRLWSSSQLICRFVGFCLRHLHLRLVGSAICCLPFRSPFCPFPFPVPHFVVLRLAFGDG